MGMGIKISLILFIVCIIVLFPFFSSVCAEDNTSVSIHMLGEAARTRFGNPVVVAGIWHFINVTLDDQIFTELNLIFYQGDSIPAIGLRDETNYYEWKYNANTQVWTDENEYEGYTYINDTNCQVSDNIYSFCVGVKDTLPAITNYHENWTLEIYKDGEQLHSENVALEKPIVGIAKSHADSIRFQVEPFTEMPDDGDDYFIIENTGNIPLDVTIDYGAYNDFFEVSDSGKKLSPYSTFNYYVTLYSESWKPGKLTISGINRATGSISGSLIITTATITFNVTQIINAADLEVSIGHSNCEIKVIPGSHIVFQYEKTLEMDEGQVRDVTVYISGEGLVTLDIFGDGENVEILKVSSEDQTGTPLIIASTNTSEYAVTVRVEALRENKVGVIYYNLEVDGEIHSYNTQITIGPPSSKQETSGGGIPTTTIIVALVIVLVIGYMIYSQIRYRRR